ncbi:MAG: DUF2752 domain-containing protein [Phycisphaerales bacterium]|nr:MAG: DUF2752 domain-containing protein [Phycisphaerales bacterium]
MTDPTHTKPDAKTRAICALVALAFLAPLVVAAFLPPDPAGHGTHRALGLSQCSWAAAFDAPCATCGMTTAFSEATHGHLWRSFVVQPFGAVLAILACSGFWVCAYSAAAGSRVYRVGRTLVTTRVLTLGLVMLLAAWGYKWATWP